MAIHDGNDSVANTATRAKQGEIATGTPETDPTEKRTARRMGRYGNFDRLFGVAG